MELSEYVARSRHILITSHVSPDGDSTGACLALGSALRKMGKKTTIALSDPVPATLRFLPGWEEICGPDANLEGVDLIFVLDLSSTDRVGQLYNERVFSAATIVNIDHHPTNTNFGTINVVFPEAASTCELLWKVIKSLGVEIDKEIASCLLTGIVTDTLGFRTSNTRAETIRLAADLIEYGVSLSAVSEAVFNSKPFSAVKLMGLVLSQIQRRGRIVWTAVTKQMLAESGAGPEDCEAIINLLASVRDADAIVLFKELEEGSTRISIRTSGKLNAGQICQRFGGGGHLRAAGCGLPVGLQAAQQSFISYVEDALSST